MDLRKRMIWVGALTLATAIIQLTSVRRESEHRAETDRPSEYLKRPSTPAALNGPAEPPAANAERVRARATRDALRAKIVDAQRSAPAQPSPTDRISGHDQLVAHLDKALMPLARQCIEQAQARLPRLFGKLTLQVETISDEQLGAVVERAEVPAASEVQERELAECIREDALTLMFPPPLPSGPDKFELTLAIEPLR